MQQIHAIESNTQGGCKVEVGYQLSDAVISISNLRLRTYIGFNPEELVKQQDIVINAKIYYQAGQAVITDDESSALNYKNITKHIINYVEQGRFRLLEKLCHDLLIMVMENQQVNKVDLTIDKPHALRFADSVSLSLTAVRD